MFSGARLKIRKTKISILAKPFVWGKICLSEASNTSTTSGVFSHVQFLCFLFTTYPYYFATVSKGTSITKTLSSVDLCAIRRAIWIEIRLCFGLAALRLCVQNMSMAVCTSSFNPFLQEMSPFPWRHTCVHNIHILSLWHCPLILPRPWYHPYTKNIGSWLSKKKWQTAIALLCLQIYITCSLYT